MLRHDWGILPHWCLTINLAFFAVLDAETRLGNLLQWCLSIKIIAPLLVGHLFLTRMLGVWEEELWRGNLASHQGLWWTWDCLLPIHPWIWPGRSLGSPTTNCFLSPKRAGPQMYLMQPSIYDLHVRPSISDCEALTFLMPFSIMKSLQAFIMEKSKQKVWRLAVAD